MSFPSFDSRTYVSGVVNSSVGATGTVGVGFPASFGGSRFDESAGWESEQEEQQEEEKEQQEEKYGNTLEEYEDEEYEDEDDYEEDEQGNYETYESKYIDTGGMYAPIQTNETDWSYADDTLSSTPTSSTPTRTYATNELYNLTATATIADTAGSRSPSTLTQRHMTHVSITPSSKRGSKSQSHSNASVSSSESDADTGDDGSSSSDDEVDNDPTDELIKPLPLGADLMMRVIMCGLSVVLLWVTSLTLAAYLTSMVVGAPNLEPAVDSWVAAFSVSDRQAAMHVECISREIAACKINLNASITASEQAWSEKKHQRATNLLAIQIQAQTCTDTSTQILQGIDTWLSAGGLVTYDESACTATEIETLRTRIRDREVDKAGVNSMTQNYITTTNGILDDTAAQIGVLQTYNHEFLSNHTQELRTNYDNFERELSAATDPTELKRQLDQQTAEMKVATQNMRDCAIGTQKSNSLVDSYNVGLTSFRNSYSSLQLLGQDSLRSTILYVARVQSKFDEVQSFFNILIPFASVFDSLGLNIWSMPSLDVPTLVPSSDLIRELSNPVQLDDLGRSFERQFVEVQTKFDDKFQTLQQDITNATERQFANLTRLIQGYKFEDPFETYQPPPIEVNVEQLHQQWSETSLIFQTESAAGINHLVEVASTTVSTIDSTLSNLTDLFLTSNTTISTDTTLPTLSTFDIDINFEEFSGSFELSDIIIGLFTAVGGVFVIGDIIYRNVASMKMIYSYINQPEEMLPMIDVRTKASKEAEANARTRASSTTGRIAWLIQHPALIGMIVTIFIIWLLILFLAAYIPMYHSYEDGCLKSHDGTFLSRNSFVLLYNYASQRGQTEMILQLTEYEARRALECGRERQRQATSEYEDGSDIANVLIQQESAYTNMELIQRCITGIELPEGTVQPTIHPKLLLSDDLFRTCKVDTSSSVYVNLLSSSSSSTSFTSIFNCTDLPVCSVSQTCPGPDILTIRSTTYDSSCQTEYVLHQGIFYFGLVMIIFGCLNLSRMMFLKGMVRLGWKALTPKGITFQATCDHQGNVVTQEEKKKKKKDKKKSRKMDRRSRSVHHQHGSDSESDTDLELSRSHHTRPSSSRPVAPLPINKLALKRHIAAYESSAMNYLLFTIIAHIPYLLLLFVLKDPFHLGSSVRVEPPVPYQQEIN